MRILDLWAQDGVDEEISALIATLHSTGQRLEELTGGEVDAVADAAGRTFLLQRAQEHLRDRQAYRQAAILNALPANLALLDGLGTIVSVNDAWREFGIGNGFLGAAHGVGENYLAVCERATGADAAPAAEAAHGIRSVISGDVASFSMEYPCHSPTAERWFLMKVTPVGGGHPNGAAVMHIDISAQHRSREGLRLSEERFRQMAESIRDIFLLVDVERGWVLYMSPAYEAISGRTCESVYADPDAWYDAMHPDDRAAARAAAGAASAEAREYRHEFRFLHADGSVRWIAIRGFPVREDGGRVLRMACVAQDITRRRQRLVELEQSHQRLLLASRQAGMAEVATNILHNVGNVLNSVNVSASLAADAVHASRANGMAKVVDLMAGHRDDLGHFMSVDPQGRHILEMLAQFSGEWIDQQDVLSRELASLRANIEHIKRIVSMQQTHAKVTGAAEVVDLRELIEDSLRMNAAHLDTSRVSVVRDFQDVAPVSLEKHKVLQILVNLVSNARHACAEVAGKRHIDVGLAECNGRVVITVADTGSGIASENIVKIFAHGFTTRANGHGFGLHSGALDAAELGGTLTARSDGPGLGATFTLDLPAIRRADAALA